VEACRSETNVFEPHPYIRGFQGARISVGSSPSGSGCDASGCVRVPSYLPLWLRRGAFLQPFFFETAFGNVQPGSITSKPVIILFTLDQSGNTLRLQPRTACCTARRTRPLLSPTEVVDGLCARSQLVDGSHEFERFKRLWHMDAEPCS
jgi:hypothetical protein